LGAKLANAAKALVLLPLEAGLVLFLSPLNQLQLGLEPLHLVLTKPTLALSVA
jgi:hypothetical protein